MRYPLIDFHGNVGNIGGDGPAASRYTEARLAKIAEDGLLRGLKKKNVDFMPNYDETTEEPVTLPSIFPNLLCNPNTGIGVAMACNWLPHNLNEVAQAIYDYMDGKEPMLPGPDFPTGGLIINQKDIPTIMKTGHGTIKVRGQYKIEKNNIVFYEIPYGTSTEALMSEIGECSDNGEIEGISNVRDESTLKGLRIIIQCNRNVTPEQVVKKVFEKTNFQTSVSYNQIALVDKTPTELSLKNCVQIYIEHNNKCIVREALFDIDKAVNRLHIIIGLLKALDEIDKIIEMIKKSPSAAAAKETLINWGYSEPQAKAILGMRLSSLAKLEKEDLEKEKKELEALLVELHAICENPTEELRKRLSEIVKKYGDKRRTELTQIDIKPAAKAAKEVEAVIPEDVVVVLYQDGNIKRVPKKSFKIQHRGGTGAKNINEVILETISTNTIDNLIFFSDKGIMYRTVVDKVPVGTNAQKGTKVSSLIELEPNERIIAMTSLNSENMPKYVMFFTKKGKIKKTLLEEFLKTRRNKGIQAIKIADGDNLANVVFMNEEDVVLISKNGMSIRFTTNNINATGRVAMGVKAMTLDESDEVLTGIPLTADKTHITIVDKKGCGKRVKVEDFSLQNRGGKGIKCATNLIGGVVATNADSKILVLCKSTSIGVEVNELPEATRIALGNIVVKNEVLDVVEL